MITPDVIEMLIQDIDPQQLKQSLEFLKKILALGIDGVGPLDSAQELGNRYLEDLSYATKLERINALVKREQAKNFTSGFITSLGGIITLPLAIPAALGANWVLQTRMVAAMAHIGGFNIDDPPVRTAVALSILGNKGKRLVNADINELKTMLKERNITLPKRTILAINQIIATKMFSLASQKGFTRLSKAVPVMGGVIGGLLDLRTCREAASFADELFQFELGEGPNPQNWPFHPDQEQET